MRWKPAVQMYTLRDFTRTEADFALSLEKIRAIGYEAVQLSAIGAMSGDTPEVSATRAKQLLDDNGLQCVATHRRWDDLRDRTEAEIEFHKTLDCGFTAIGSLPSKHLEKGAEGVAEFLKEADGVIASLKASGVRFAYHNHDFEFARLEPKGKTYFDLFVEAENPDLLMELDLYWIHHAGANPIRILERCAERVPQIHIKDREVVLGEGPVMAPIGEGVMDWEAILPACDAAGVEWIHIEQDVCRRDPFDCLRSSLDYLTQYRKNATERNLA